MTKPGALPIQTLTRPCRRTAPDRHPHMAVVEDIQQASSTATPNVDKIRAAASTSTVLLFGTAFRADAHDRRPTTALRATPCPCALLPLTCALPHSYYSACPSTFHVEIIVQHETALGLDSTEIWHGCVCA